MTTEVLSTRAVRYELDIAIQATPTRVWDALTAQINAWWLPDFHVAGTDSVVRLDPAPGGQLIERTPDGGGIVWYTVHACVPGRSMTLVGPLSVDCGPATTMLIFTLQEQGEGCLLKVLDQLVGHVGDELVDGLRDGSDLVLGKGLKRHVEGQR
jgi:uncharacterized protein YndB with AHSA1/START domain